MTDATPGAIASGGMRLSVAGAAMWELKSGCSTRVAINIAVNNNAAAR